MHNNLRYRSVSNRALLVVMVACFAVAPLFVFQAMHAQTTVLVQYPYHAHVLGVAHVKPSVHAVPQLATMSGPSRIDGV